MLILEAIPHFARGRIRFSRKNIGRLDMGDRNSLSFHHKPSRRALNFPCPRLGAQVVLPVANMPPFV